MYLTVDYFFTEIVYLSLQVYVVLSSLHPNFLFIELKWNKSAPLRARVPASAGGGATERSGIRRSAARPARSCEVSRGAGRAASGEAPIVPGSSAAQERRGSAGAGLRPAPSPDESRVGRRSKCRFTGAALQESLECCYFARAARR